MSTKKTKQKAVPANATSRVFPVVGIGASAGGIEVLSQFLSGVSADTGMAFVVVQHLAPTHVSMLSEILARSTRMPVKEVQDGMTIQPNHVYVIPPDTNLSITGNRLYLLARTEARGQHMPIDFFFSSLALDRGMGAIGIILSGTASDGTIGLRAIKSEGGVTFAQDPETAAYDGMPRSAISAGVVDLVLGPEEIAQELLKIRKHPFVRSPLLLEEPSLPEGRDELAKIYFLVRSATGVDFSGYKDTTIRRRIKRRMVLHRIDSLKNYVRFLQGNRTEISQLFDDILINVTSFFRDPEAFEALRTEVFPELAKANPPNTPIRIWVPGCSTGQEAYSIAITLLEFLSENAATTPIQLFATDIDEHAVEVARAGFYPASIENEVSPERLRKFFVRSEGGYRISKTVRDICVFARQDVTRDPPFSRIDLISCRNVLIYLGHALQKRVLSIFHYALKKPGFLFLGTSESIGEFAHLFQSLDAKQKLYSKKAIAAPIGTHYLQADFGRPRAEATRKPEEKASSVPDLKAEIDRVLLARFAPSGVLVNESFEILQFRGQTGAYLEPAPGEASLNILTMARSGLMVELRTALQAALRTRAPVRREKIRIDSDGHSRLIDLEIQPVDPGTGARLLLVLFQESEPAKKARGKEKKAAAPKPGIRKSGATLAENARLKQELAAVREFLQTVIHDSEAANQELQSANEEIVSSNEELQSTNEELETAKEELQSTNEELSTVNDELNARNTELTRANNDQVNLLSSVSIPIVMVGIDLRIRRFTPMAEKLLNLIPSDLGRPISDMKLKVEIPNLEKIVLDVIDTMSTREEQVQDSTGHWYSVRVRPYKTAEKQIDGAVIALIDIDETKRALEDIERSRLFGACLMEFVQSPVLVLDADLRVQSANPAYYEKFATQPQKTEGRALDELADGKWDLPGMRKLLSDASAKAGVTVSGQVDSTWISVFKSPARPHCPQFLLLRFYDEGRFARETTRTKSEI